MKYTYHITIDGIPDAEASFPWGAQHCSNLRKALQRTLDTYLGSYKCFDHCSTEIWGEQIAEGLIIANAKTGLYFDGTNFSAETVEGAKRFHNISPDGLAKRATLLWECRITIHSEDDPGTILCIA